ncbi:MAG: hypothetical protein LUE17_05930 [Planctomycetaceae bacterium]|nr:hypothetical protein [Planctomycetaceae bacterium]
MPDQASKRAAEEIFTLIKTRLEEQLPFLQFHEAPQNDLVHIANIIERHMGDEISSLREQACNLYEALKLSIQDEDMWACKYCGQIIHWETGHADRGCIWSCEVCGDTFCAQCARERNPQYEERDDVRCPDCLSKEAEPCHADALQHSE